MWLQYNMALHLNGSFLPTPQFNVKAYEVRSIYCCHCLRPRAKDQVITKVVFLVLVHFVNLLNLLNYTYQVAIA
jgi:hypothetical protein